MVQACCNSWRKSHPAPCLRNNPGRNGHWYTDLLIKRRKAKQFFLCDIHSAEQQHESSDGERWSLLRVRQGDRIPAGNRARTSIASDLHRPFIGWLLCDYCVVIVRYIHQVRAIFLHPLRLPPNAPLLFFVCKSVEIPSKIQAISHSILSRNGTIIWPMVTKKRNNIKSKIWKILIFFRICGVR